MAGVGGSASSRKPVENSDYNINIARVHQANEQIPLATTRNTITLAAILQRQQPNSEFVPSGKPIDRRRTIAAGRQSTEPRLEEHDGPTALSGPLDAHKVTNSISGQYLTTMNNTATPLDDLYLTGPPPPPACPSSSHISHVSNSSHASMPYPRSTSPPTVNMTPTTHPHSLEHVPRNQISHPRSTTNNVFSSTNRNTARHLPNHSADHPATNQNTTRCAANQNTDPPAATQNNTSGQRSVRPARNLNTAGSVANFLPHNQPTRVIPSSTQLTNTSRRQPPTQLTQPLNISLHSIDHVTSQPDRNVADAELIYENSAEANPFLPVPPPELPPRLPPPRTSSIPSWLARSIEPSRRSSMSSHPYQSIPSTGGKLNCVRANDCRKWFTCIGVLVALLAVGLLAAVIVHQNKPGSGAAAERQNGSSGYYSPHTTASRKNITDASTVTDTTTMTTTPVHCPEDQKFYCWDVECPHAGQGAPRQTLHCSNNFNERNIGRKLCCNITTSGAIDKCEFKSNPNCKAVLRTKIPS